jgi:hypothetical protein
MAFFATVQTFFLRPKKPLANFMIRLRLALEATLFTDLGIFLHFLIVGDPDESGFLVAKNRVKH